MKPEDQTVELMVENDRLRNALMRLMRLMLKYLDLDEEVEQLRKEQA